MICLEKHAPDVARALNRAQHNAHSDFFGIGGACARGFRVYFSYYGPGGCIGGAYSVYGGPAGVELFGLTREEAAKLLMGKGA